MICTRLQGGLGNQLFQYSSGYALARALDCELRIDLSGLTKRSSKITPRDYELHHFKLTGKIASPTMMRSLSVARALPFNASLLCGWRCQRENHDTDLDERFTSFGHQSYLVGYWQSHKYFERYSAELFQQLTQDLCLDAESLRIAQAMTDTTSVSVHVRRGDYLTSAEASTYHGALTQSYYRSGIELMKQNFGKVKFFVFSDDISWCFDNLGLQPSEAVYVDHNSGVNSWRDLILMSYCTHAIIANSSFSWWGAWLGDQRRRHVERAVLAPRKWFNHRSVEVSQRFPASWNPL